MSKTKRNLIIVGSIVGTLLLLMIIFGALFSLKTIKVDYATSTNRVNLYAKDDIIANSGIKTGKNIVFANYKNAERQLESKYPYAKFNVVKVFPNTAIIYVYERVPVFRVFNNGLWYIFDEDLKCLEIVAQVNIEENNNDEIPVLNYEIENLVNKVGEFLQDTKLKNTMKTILDGVYAYSATPLDIMSDITLSKPDILGNSEIVLKVKNSGTTLVIEGENNIKEKIAYAVMVYLTEISQDNNYINRLDQVVITIKKAFSLDNKSGNIIVSCP